MRWPSFRTLELESDGPITWLRLNRPERLNALTEESFAELGAALRAVAGDPETHVAVLTGNGRGFCAGSDLEGLESRFEWTAADQWARFQRLGKEVVLGLHELPVPTLAAINGPVSGGGLSLALACDIRIAAAAATFSTAFAGVGLIPDLGATYFLPRAIGLGRAFRLVWTNERLLAGDALKLGLVDEVVAASELEGRVRALAAQIASAPQTAVRLARAALRAGCHARLADALDAEAAAQSACLQSAEHRERVRELLAQRSTPAATPTKPSGCGGRGEEGK